MDTYKRSIRGLQSRSNGEHFEGMILAASRFYEERGIAAVDKLSLIHISEPTRP